MSESIGIIAGSGQFPRLVAEDAKAAGYGVVVCAFHGFTDPGLEALALADKHHFCIVARTEDSFGKLRLQAKAD